MANGIVGTANAPTCGVPNGRPAASNGVANAVPGRRMGHPATGRLGACITSPPYWGLRDYGLPPAWDGGDRFASAGVSHNCRNDLRRRVDAGYQRLPTSVRTLANTFAARSAAIAAQPGRRPASVSSQR